MCSATHLRRPNCFVSLLAGTGCLGVLRRMPSVQELTMADTASLHGLDSLIRLSGLFENSSRCTGNLDVEYWTNLQSLRVLNLRQPGDGNVVANDERLSQLSAQADNGWHTAHTPHSIQEVSIVGTLGCGLSSLTRLTALQLSPNENWVTPLGLLELCIPELHDGFAVSWLASLTHLTMLD